MQNIGAKGQNYLEKLIKYVPELNPAANLTEEEKAKINENEDLKESKEILDSINITCNIFHYNFSCRYYKGNTRRNGQIRTL